MIEIGRKGIFTIDPPYAVAAVEYEVVGIQTISAMLSMGLNPFNLIYKPVGLDATYYTTVPRDTLIAVLKSVTDVRYVPVTAVKDSESTSYVNYSNKVLVVNLGGHPATTNFTGLLNAVMTEVEQAVGVIPILEVKDISKPIQIAMDEHQRLQTARGALIVATTPTNNNSSRDQEIRLLTTRIKTLEQFLMRYSAQCGTTANCVCEATAESYQEDVVFYQYSLADYYVQSLRGDIHDFPLNNAFVWRLHEKASNNFMVQ